MRKHVVMLSALVAAFASFAAPFTDGGVTYTPNDEVTRRQPVVTGVNVTGMVESVAYTKGEVDRRIETNAPVRSVNGKTGRVVLGANDVGALPNNRDGLKASANFRNAVWDVQIKPDAAHDGAARVLPPYLHEIEFDSTYPADAAWYYTHADYSDAGMCSVRRTGNTVERNFDWKFDFMPEFVLRTTAAEGRFASLGVASVGKLLTEADVVSGKWSPYYRCLPGHTVDGVNEKGVFCEVNVVDGEPDWDNPGGDIHPLGGVRWVLDYGTNAQQAAAALASRIAFPSGWSQNFHYLVADKDGTWIVENGAAHSVTGTAVMTNFKLYPNRDTNGAGQERYDLLDYGEPITNAWWTLAYLSTTSPVRVSDIGTDTSAIFAAWANGDRESHRGQSAGGKTWWQTVHTAVYNLDDLSLRVCVQERGEWYDFRLRVGGGGNIDDGRVRDIVQPMIGAATNGIPEAVSALQSGKRGLDDLKVYEDGYTPWNFDDPYNDAYRDALGLDEVEVEQDPNDPAHFFFTTIARSDIESGGEILYHEGDEITFNTNVEEPDILNAEWVDGGVFLFLRSHRSETKVPSGDYLAKESQIASFISTNESGIVLGSNRLRFEQLNVGEPETEYPPAFKVTTGAGPYYAELKMAGGAFHVITHDNESMTGGRVYEFSVNGTNVMDWIASKRPLADNTCHKTEYGEWMLDDNRYVFQEQPRWSDNTWVALVTYQGIPDFTVFSLEDRQDVLELHFSDADIGYFTATRSAVCTSNETFTTTSYVTNAVNASKYVPSATDPTFSNAVVAVGFSFATNEVTSATYIAATNVLVQLGFDEETIGELPGGKVYGSLGALLAALAAAVAFLRKKTVHLESDGTADNDFATDLLGKQVAKEAIDDRTKASASAITGDALTLPDGGVVSASSSAPTITFGTARQDGLRFCELYITNPDTAADGAIVSISGKVYSDISLTDLPKLEKGATYYFTFAEFKVDNGVSWWKVSKQKLDAIGGDIPTPTAA